MNRFLTGLAVASFATSVSAQTPDPTPRPHAKHGAATVRWTADAIPEDLRRNYEMAGSITLVSLDGSGAIGLNAGPFVDGRWTWAEGRHGRIGMDAARLDGKGRAVVGVTREGLRGDLFTEGYATLVGLSGQTGYYGAQSKDGLTRAGTFADGRALLGANGLAVASTHLTTEGVHAVGGAHAFAGAKAKGDVVGTIAVCGLAATGTASGDVSFGLGAGALGFFRLDWTRGVVKVGGRADVTAGPGVGGGAAVEISIEQILRDPQAAKACVVDGVIQTYDILVSGTQRLLGLSRARPEPTTGLNVARHAPTRGPLAAGRTVSTPGAAGAGMLR